MAITIKNIDELIGITFEDMPAELRLALVSYKIEHGEDCTELCKIFARNPKYLRG